MRPPAGGHTGFKSLSDVIASLSPGYADSPRVHAHFFGCKHKGTRKRERQLHKNIARRSHHQSCSRMRVQGCKGETKNSSTTPEAISDYISRDSSKTSSFKTKKAKLFINKSHSLGNTNGAVIIFKTHSLRWFSLSLGPFSEGKSLLTHRSKAA